jgi:hypothetical protein
VKKPVKTIIIEPRWPVVLTILAVVFLLAVLPGRIRLFSTWAIYVMGIALITPIMAVHLSGAKARWQRIESAVLLLFIAVGEVVTLVNLGHLISAITGRSMGLSGMQLLTSSVAVWVTNVLMFSLLYWNMDRGGPEARMNNTNYKPDWLFPQAEAGEDAPPNWCPTFVDYLFLGYTTATAFSPTEALPATSRAKMLMMIQSAISLVTIVIVASRAINILGN